VALILFLFEIHEINPIEHSLKLQMCGFVGIKNKSNVDVEAVLLSRMASTINHRGPDDEGFLIEGNIGFFHKRLSIIDLALGHQPMTRGEITIVYNGEIYNYKELREALKKAGFSFHTNSDTEVLLAMYEAYGYDFIKKLNGMFAFLIYDRRNNQLIAARDHFGIKPLYYANTKENFIFASEIKAILPHPSVSVEPNLNAINEYFTFQYVLGNETLFKNIYKILPGQMLIIDLDTNEINSVKYWDPSYKVDSFHTEEYFVHELRKLLEHSVEIQLRSDVPVGTYLSGGLDSSIITSLAAKKYSSKLKTFTGAFKEGKEYDESQYAQIVAESCDAEIFRIYPTANDFIDLMPKLIYHLDEPVAGPGVFPQYMVSRLASKEVKVILGGQGGDEIFGGYTRYIVAYFEQALKGAIFENNEEGEHIVSLQSIIPNLPYLKNYIPMIKEFTKMERFEPMDKRYFHLVDRKNGSHNLFTKEYRENYNREFLFKKFQKLFNHPDTQSYYNKMTHYDILNNLPALLHVEDRVSMAVSLESRVPLIDHRIVELIASMPASMKFKGAEMKYILKKSIDDLVPKTIMDRRDKMGFPVPLHLWAKDSAHQFLQDVLLSKQCKERGIFNIEALEHKICNEREFGRTLWGMLSLELWFRTFIDKELIYTTNNEYNTGILT